MSGPIPFVNKGDSFPFVFDRDGETTEGWICTIHVKEFKSDASLITRVIPLDANNQWSGYLTSTETDTLTAPTLYRLIAILTNAANVEEEQVLVRFQLNEAWA
jgi:hypothetical protein